MRFLYVPNLDRWQHYKDRNPPWIKLHRDLLNDYDFACLQDASKLHLTMIWVLASQMDNRIPEDGEWIARKINATEAVNINLLIERGFLKRHKDGSNALAVCEQSAMRETETETEEDRSRRRDPSVESVNGTARFDEWWTHYPKKRGRADAKKAWKVRKLDPLADRLISDVKKRQESDRQWKQGYIPNPATYLRGERWEDEMSDAENVVTVEKWK